MPYAIWYQEPVLHILCKFLWEGFLTVSSVFIRVKSFFDTPHAVWCGKFLFSFTCLVLVYLGSFSGTLTVSLSGEFLLHVLCCFKWGVCLTQPLLFSVGSFSYTPCCFMWGVSLPRPVLFYVGSFSYTLCYRGAGGGPLHAPCFFMLGDSRTRSMLFYVGNFSYTVPADWCGGFSDITGAYFYGGSLFSMPYAIWHQEFVLHTLCLCGEVFE